MVELILTFTRLHKGREGRVVEGDEAGVVDTNPGLTGDTVVPRACLEYFEVGRFAVEKRAFPSCRRFSGFRPATRPASAAGTAWASRAPGPSGTARTRRGSVFATFLKRLRRNVLSIVGNGV